MRKGLPVYILFFILPAMLQTTAQPTLFFRKITTEQGLNDGAVQAIARDHEGYMWISTIGGLNRYDGVGFRFFDRVESDTGRVLLTICRSMTSDAAGRFFFGFENGLGQYDFAKRTIRMVPALGNTWVLDMQPVNDTALMLLTYEGWMRYNPVSQLVYKLKNSRGYKWLEERGFPWCFHKGQFYFADDKKVFAYEATSGKVSEVVLPPGLAFPSAITHLAMDGAGNLWIGLLDSRTVIRFPLGHTNWQSFPNLLPAEDLSRMGMYAHPLREGVWIGTTSSGLLQYRPAQKDFVLHAHNSLQPWTSNTNLIRCVHLDDDGSLWFGGDFGVNIAYPNRTLFTIIPPFDTDITNRNRRVARVACEDSSGNLWFGTLDGVVRFDPRYPSYREYNNRPGRRDALHSNSVRGLAADDEGRIWIATGAGINRLHISSGKMDFLSAADSLPNSFYFSVNTDRFGNLWFSSRDGVGLFWYQKEDRKVYSIASHPYLRVLSGKGFRYVYHDSRGRYWMGFNGAGLAMYDPSTKQVETWSSIPGKNGAIAGNYVVDIKEDRKGCIWVSTFSGLTSINPADMGITNYTTNNGLPSNTISGLAVDSLNRLWIGTARGLVMLDGERQFFTSFGRHDGLPSTGFPEHAAIKTRNGDWMMGTLNGYIRFKPENFQPGKSQLPCYIASIQLAGESQPILPDSSDFIKLPYYHNSLTFQLVGINYVNPAQTWYAYRLQGFNKDWTYTQDPRVVYTNLPGGTYQFEYKAGTNAYQWDMTANTLTIRIGIIFYKTPWFIILCTVALVGILYMLYRWRIDQQQHVFDLQARTQALEKEKAMVMYENLKQHLNPHFLFNSLTSLSSLIRIDQQMAGDFLERMSKIYRYILKNRDSETVTLQEELNFVNNFIELQKTRFESGLQVNVQIDEEHLFKKLVPVTLQNLVENAIKHNTTNKNKPLRIDFLVEEDYLVVRNNLQRKTFVETSNNQGLQSMKDLYKYLTGRPLLVQEDEYYFTVKVPLI